MEAQQQYKNLMKFGFSAIIWGIMLAFWAATWMHNFAELIIRPFGFKGNWLVIAVYGILLFIFTSFYGGYRIGYYRKEDVVFSSFLALIFTNLIIYFQTCLLWRNLVTVSPFLLMTAVQMGLVWIWAMASSAVYIRVFPPHQMLLVYGGSELAKHLIEKMICRSEKYIIREAVAVEKGYDVIIEKVKEYEAVILCDIPAKMRNTLLKYCFQNSIRTYTTPKISDILVRGAEKINLFDTPLLLSRNGGLSPEQRFIKRLCDLVISGVGLIVASPFMLVTAILIKLCDRGPVLFRQKRCTIGNRAFTVLKFRSMIVDAEKEGISQPAIDNDPRITAIGKLLRKTRMDELPQLWNIFRGDMSIVGPRPERVEHVEEYTKLIPEFGFRSKVKAGLTGKAQIYGRYNTTAYDKLKMDLMYIVNYSLIEDFRLLLMTLKIIFVKDSTAGFESKNAMNIPIKK